jgi:hypothetical protein
MFVNKLGTMHKPYDNNTKARLAGMRGGKTVVVGE